jgi:hypothetical protein
MEQPGNEKDEGILVGAFFDDEVTFLNREKLAVVTEKTAVLFFQVGNNPEGREFGAIKV